jgi:hypothetical protein
MLKPGILSAGVLARNRTSRYWNTLISATVEDAAPTHLVMTFSKTFTLNASDLTITGITATILSGSWTGSVYTLVLSTDVTYVDSLTIVYKGTYSKSVTNNVVDPARALKYTSISRFSLQETQSGQNLNADLLSPVSAYLSGETAPQMILPDITGLNAVGAFSIYIDGYTFDNTYNQTIFDRLGTTSTWLQTIFLGRSLCVDVSGYSPVTSRWQFSNFLNNGRFELLIIFDATQAKATRVQIYYNGTLISPDIVPSGTATTTTGTPSSPTNCIGGINVSNYTMKGHINTFGLWNTVQTLANCRIGTNSPLCFYPGLWSGVDVSGNGKHITTFTSVIMHRGCCGWHYDYGYTLYNDGGSNSLMIPYNNAGNPVITASTYTVHGITYNKISEHIANPVTTLRGDLDVYIDFDPKCTSNSLLYLFNRSDIWFFSSSGRGATYDSSRPYAFNNTDLNRQTLTAFYNMPHQFFVYPKFNGNSVDNRDYMIELFVLSFTILTPNKINAILRYTNDYGKVTVGTQIMGYEGALTDFNADPYIEYKVNTFRWEAVKGTKVFATKNKTLWISNDGGTTFTGVFKQDLVYSVAYGDITFSYIWANGNISFFTRNKAYLANSDLSVINEITVYESNGTTPITDRAGTMYYNQMPQADVMYDSNGAEILVWGNYCNVSWSGHTALAEDNIFCATNNGANIRVAYKWGVNPNTGCPGDAGNANYCRHNHFVIQNPVTGKFYGGTGDLVDETHLIEGVFNPTNNTWVWNILQSGLSWIFSGAKFRSGVFYVTTDLAGGLLTLTGSNFVTQTVIKQLVTPDAGVFAVMDDNYVIYTGENAQEIRTFNGVTLYGLAINALFGMTMYQGRQKVNNWYLFDGYQRIFPDFAPNGSQVLIRIK